MIFHKPGYVNGAAVIRSTRMHMQLLEQKKNEVAINNRDSVSKNMHDHEVRRDGRWISVLFTEGMSSANASRSILKSPSTLQPSVPRGFF